MPALNFPNLTPSRASALSCRKRFHAEHIARSVPAAGFARCLSFGSAVHALLKDAYHPQNTIPLPDRDLDRSAQRAFAREPYPDATVREEDCAAALDLVTAYVRQADPSEETVGVEVYESLTLPP